MNDAVRSVGDLNHTFNDRLHVLDPFQGNIAFNTLHSIEWEGASARSLGEDVLSRSARSARSARGMNAVPFLADSASSGARAIACSSRSQMGPVA